MPVLAAAEASSARYISRRPAEFWEQLVQVALVVDWPDLLAHLEGCSVSWVLQPLVNSLTESARDYALSATGSVGSSRVYATPATVGSEEAQRIWYDAGFQLHTQPSSPTEVRDRIVADCLELVLEESCGAVILVCGESEYRQLSRSLRRHGARFELWKSRNPAAGSSEERSVLDILQLSTSSIPKSYSDHGDGELSGVLRLLRREVIKRTQAQLSREARKLSSEKAIKEAFASLAEEVRLSGFTPTSILAWTDETRHWNGSLTVAGRLSELLDCEVAVAEIREEGESRAILSRPDLQGNGMVLVVDDAAFTGRTLRMLRAACLDLAPESSVRTAVLSALDPVCEDVDFAPATHRGKDVLFPWGWARSVDQFYDLLRELGTRDRRWMPRTYTGELRATELTEGEASFVRLLSWSSESAPETEDEATLELAGSRQGDHLLYVIREKAEVTIDGATGVFDPGEFIFIPRVVPYSLALRPESEVLSLEFRDGKP